MDPNKIDNPLINAKKGNFKNTILIINYFFSNIQNLKMTQKINIQNKKQLIKYIHEVNKKLNK